MVEPEWATKLIGDVLYLYNRTKRPKVKWLSSGDYQSSGWAYPSNYSKIYGRGSRRYRKERVDILIRQSTTNLNRYVLLHEMVHWMLRAKHHHDKVFWKKAWELYYVFLSKDELENAKKSEFAYMKKAEVVYNELFPSN